VHVKATISVHKLTLSAAAHFFRSLSPTMVAEYERQPIPKEVLPPPEEFMRFLE
jgi:hypothetical protein